MVGAIAAPLLPRVAKYPARMADGYVERGSQTGPEERQRGIKARGGSKTSAAIVTSSVYHLCIIPRVAVSIRCTEDLKHAMNIIKLIVPLAHSQLPTLRITPALLTYQSKNRLKNAVY